MTIDENVIDNQKSTSGDYTSHTFMEIYKIGRTNNELEFSGFQYFSILDFS